jgi:tetratricopeptide (TPR) repeat protein
VPESTTSHPQPPPSPPPASVAPAPTHVAGAADGLIAQVADLLRTAQTANLAGEKARARASSQQAETTLRQRLSTEPSNVNCQLALARALEVTSEIEVDSDLRRAADTVEEAIRIRLSLVNTEPDNVEYLLALGVAYNNLGTVALAHCDADEAIRWMQVSCQVFQDALSAEPSSTDAQRHVGQGTFRLGKIAAADSQNTLARAAFEQSVTARRRLVTSRQDHQAWNELAESLEGLGGAQCNLVDDAAAEQTSREAVEAMRNAIVDQSDESGHRNLALGLVKSAAMAANVNDPHASARQALEAASIWARYGTQESRRRWPQIAQLLTKAAPAAQAHDAQLADACRRAAAKMS